MQFVRKLFGWGGSEEASPGSQSSHDDAVDPRSELHRQRRAAQRQQQAAAAEAAAGPLLTEEPAGGGGIQGLDWFLSSMRKDSDGDCAHHFLEEPCRQAERRRQQPSGSSGSGGGGRGSPEGAPMAAKQQRGAVLQDSSQRAMLAGPSDMLLDRGCVYVVPHEAPR